MIKTTLLLLLFCSLSFQQNFGVTSIPIPTLPPPIVPTIPPPFNSNWQQQLNNQIEALQDQLSALQEQWNDIFDDVFGTNEDLGEIEQLVVPQDLDPNTILIETPGAQDLILSLEDEEWSYEYDGEGEADFYDVNFGDGDITILPENGGNITISENGGVSIRNVSDVKISSNLDNVSSVINHSQSSNTTTTSQISSSQSP